MFLLLHSGQAPIIAAQRVIGSTPHERRCRDRGEGDGMTDLQLLSVAVLCAAVIVAGGLGLVALALSNRR